MHSARQVEGVQVKVSQDNEEIKGPFTPWSPGELL